MWCAVGLLPNVMHYSAIKGHFTLYFQSGAVVETLEKSSGMLQNFWVQLSITPIHFQCVELGQQ